MIKIIDILKQHGYGITEERNKKYCYQKIPMIGLSLTPFCSHKCWYCISGKPYKASYKSIIDKIGIKEYIKKILFLAGDSKVEYRLSGGEPTEHWAFGEVTSALLNSGHTVVIQTNGTNAQIIENTLSKYDKEIINMVSYEISFHLGSYLRDKNNINLNKYLNIYFEKIISRCGKFGVVVPLTPNILSCINTEQYFDILKNIAFKYNFINDPTIPKTIFSLTELYGKFNNKKYPKEYSQEEKEKIVYLKQKYQDINFTINEINELGSIDRILKLKDMPCYYMNQFLRISYDGKINLCGSGHPRDKNNYKITDKILPKVEIKATPCCFDTCNCISMGTCACLNPNGISYKDYLKFLGQY
jgi:hypothetical protein